MECDRISSVARWHSFFDYVTNNDNEFVINMPRGGVRKGAGRMPVWGESQTMTIRVPKDHAERLKLMAHAMSYKSVYVKAKEFPERLVWWLCQKDCEKIGEPLALSSLKELPYYPLHRYWGVCDRRSIPIPEYMQDLYVLRWGRAGRWRLWSDNSLDHCHIPSELPIKYSGQDYGGIVFDSSDLEMVQMLPGFVTDLHFNVVEGSLLERDLDLIRSLPALLRSISFDILRILYFWKSSLELNQR